MTLTAIPANFLLPRFPANIERSFQTGYYVRVRPTLRLISCLLAATIILYALLGLRENMAFVGAFNIPQLLLCLLIFGLTWVPSFGRVWQPMVVVVGWLVALCMFDMLASHMIAQPTPITDGVAQQIILRLIFTLQVCVFMVTMATFRLTFVPTLGLQCGVTAIGAIVFASNLASSAEGPHALLQFFQPVLVVLLAVLLSSFVQEKLARGAFEYNRRISELQIHEHQMRVETEKMLHILNGAIGGIVHDLGNPLTTVQTGAELTRDVLRDDQTSRETLRELNAIVLRGARMLGFLRISLIEQTRVLEGKPVPVELKPVPIRAIIEAATSFQQQRFAQGHPLRVEGEDVSICADEMKMVTVLMNLIGNALKYSDGEISIQWHSQEELLHLAVMDAGTQGQGITHEQAHRLFSPFGRLETHANIEGTGLGLLSVRKIVEAHGGQVWIEGFTDGIPTSPTFSTADEIAPSLFPSPFRTAFVLTCPLSA